MKHLLLFALISLIYLNVYSQNTCSYKTGVPDELYRKRYKEADMVYGHPYTMFNKRAPGWTFESAVETIRLKLKSPNGAEYRSAFHYVYAEAINVEPSHCSYDQKECKHSRWVKANAIVYILGVKETVSGSGAPLVDLSPTEKTEYKTRVFEGLRNLNPKLPDCWGLEACDPIMERAFNLIQYLEAYDIMKGAGEFGGTGDGDRNEGDCSPRNKLREFARTLYIEGEDIINNRTGWKKNQGVICGSALVMAGIVLNDAGVETNWATGLFGFLWGDGINIPRPNYSPGNWVDRGHGNGGYDIFGGEDGLEENFFDGYHTFTPNVPQTSSDGKAGYAEGPGYFNYLSKAFIPLVRAMDNFVPDWNDKNYLHKEKYLNMLRWFKNIQTAGGTLPSYDNTKGVPYTLNILGVPEFASKVGFNHLDLYGDFLLANAPTKDFPEVTQPDSALPDTYSSMESGNSILRTRDKNGEDYFMFLHETGRAVDQAASTEDGTHEDSDFGSFIIYKGDNQVAYDPQYTDDEQAKTNKYDDHNIIQLLDGGNVAGNLFTSPIIKMQNTSMQLSYKCYAFNLTFEPISDLDRHVAHFHTGGSKYWILNDKISGSSGNIDQIRWQLNGIGKTSTGTYSYSDRINKWTGAAAFIAHSTFLNGDNDIVTPYSKYETTGANATVSNLGTHTRIEYFQNRRNTLIQSLIYPYSDIATIPEITRREDNGDYVTTTLRFKNLIDTTFRLGKNVSTDSNRFVTDTTYDLHIARMSSGTTILSDPFHRMQYQDTIKTDGLKSFASMNTYRAKTLGFCAPSFVKIKSCALYGGTFISIDDTNYIEASTNLDDVEYSYAGKYRYEGYCSGAGSVTFYMPDMQYGYPMKATGDPIATYSHNDTGNYKFISVYFSKAGKFVLELRDPCSDDCYFPPTNITIDTTFNFDIGLLKTLSHDLDIVRGDGVLNITNQSRMSICPDNVLVNKDSIIMYMGCAPEKTWIVNEDGSKVFLPQDTLRYICDRTLLMADRAVNETRNAIIVNNKAGLVLDSGSVTHIGLNSTILIRAGGTLLVKRGATVIVGDSDCVQNRGELLADHGAYVCIEEGAVIKFYNDIDSFNFYYKDTIDRHLVYIAMPKGSGKPGAIAGVNAMGGRGKFDITKGGIWSTSNCVPFCYLKDKNPPHGINNRPFGWSNIGLPRAQFTSADTLCVGKPFAINATRSLNETGYTITVCKYDTGSHACITSIDSITDNGDNCLSTRYLFTPTETGYYRVRLIVQNDCRQTDTFTKILYVPDVPIASISITSDSICPGVGSLYANGSLSISNIAICKHRWTIEPIIDDSTDINALIGLEGNRDWLIDSLPAVDSAFNFPGYHFTGGVRYLVSLTVWGWCGDSTIWDTVEVHSLRARIARDTLKVYPDIDEYSHVTIHVLGSGYSNILWTITTNLDTSDLLNPIASPTTDTKYTITAEDNYGCVVSDSVIVRAIYCAKAGFDKTICKGDSVHIGIEPPPSCFPDPMAPWNTICVVSNCFGGFLWVPSDGLDDPNSMNPKASPSTTTRYTLYLFEELFLGDEESTPPVIEFDQVIVYVDSTLSPSIEVIYQMDSTLYFTPSRLPLLAEYTYLWTFGDGDSSTLMNPGHTFPAFDSVYRVCLAVTNTCGTYTYCDTIHVDSSGLSQNIIGKRSIENTQNDVKKRMNNIQDKSILRTTDSEVLLDNIPNPFTESTSISYVIGKEYKNAEIRVTDVLGRIVKTYPIRSMGGKIDFDGNPYKRGLYYSVLIIDGVVAKSKTMLIN